MLTNILLSFLIILAVAGLALSLRFAVHTMHAPIERQKRVIHFLMGMVMLRMPWLSNPELVAQNAAEKKREKFFKAVRSFSISLIATCTLFFLIGLLNVKSDRMAVIIFSFILAPLIGIGATFYTLMWRLMIKTQYVVTTQICEK